MNGPPKAHLVIELDGSQHFQSHQKSYDRVRGAYLKEQGLSILRFNNLQVLQETRGVLEVIYQALSNELRKNPP